MVSSQPQTQAYGYLSFWGKVSFVLLLPVLFVNWLWRFVYLTVSGNKHWKQRVVLAFLQAEYATFTAQQRQASARRQLTGPAVESYCRSKNLSHRKVTLDVAPKTTKNGSVQDVPRPTLHFVTPRSAPVSGPTLFYSHGGAYTKPMRAGGHMPFVLHCAKACKAREIIFLEYSLAPEHRYPVQLVQIVTAVRYLLEKTGLRPEDVVLAGDSAGGHLTASLLAHIVRPSPYAPPLELGEGERFRAVVFVSPFVDLGTGHASFENNVRTDYLDAKAVQVLLGHFRPEYDDVWGNICDGQGAKEVWGRVFSGGGIVGRVLVTAGGGEVLLDGIRRFGTDFVGARTVVVDRGVDVGVLRSMDFALVEAVGEAHVQPALDSFLGYHEGSMMRGIVAFLESVYPASP